MFEMEGCWKNICLPLLQPLSTNFYPYESSEILKAEK